MANYRLAGVLGGMGPLATVDFLSKVVAHTPASRDQEHIPLIVHQVPQIPDRGAAILEGSDAPFAPMLQGLHRLATAGAEFAVIACNSAHHWHARLQSAQPLPILHIADAVRDELQRTHPHGLRAPLVILGTRGVHASRIYQQRIGDRVPLRACPESIQPSVDGAIRAVKAGEHTRAREFAADAVHRALDEGAEALVLACTELPIALRDDALSAHCIDSTAALARLCVAESRRESRHQGSPE